MKLVFMNIPTQPMIFFKPIARQLCRNVQAKLIDPNLETSMAVIESHLGRHIWFAGEYLTLADFLMSFAVLALLARSNARSWRPGWPASRPGPPTGARAGQGRPGPDASLSACEEIIGSGPRRPDKPRQIMPRKNHHA